MSYVICISFFCFAVISRKNRQNKMNANPCEVCRFQNKQCVNNCMFALLFPSSDLEKFDVVNRIFGLETLTFYLKDLSPMERIDTTRTLYYEAKPCFLNPPKNPSKFLEALLNYPYQKAEEVSKTKKLLASYSRPCVVLALPAPKYTQSKSKPSVLRKRKRKTKSSDESAIRVVEDS
ncbi:unnamed protein product [Arabidopsis thaliana]|nr:unnamed protein product [Arabidopsis thaliana]